LVADGFDVALLQELSFDHTVIVPLGFLAPETVPPLIPLYVNAFLRPLPSAARCLALGRALRAAIEPASEDDRRIVVLATGSISLEIGGPRISEDSHTGVPDPAWLSRVVELLRAGDVDALVAASTDEQLWRAGNAGGELLDWITMLGTFDPRPPGYIDVQPQFGHAFALWELE
jgi:protocatechuate 4,5-dioxygenase beta chain